MLSGVELGEVREALTRAFGPDEFDMFLFERLNFDRSVHIAQGPFKVVVSDVLKKAQQEGWEAQLIAEVAAARPLKQDIQQVYGTYAAALVDDARRQAVDAARLTAIEQFGLGPRVRLQKAGVAQLPAATSLADPGLEKRVRLDLPLLNVGLWREQMLRIEGQVCRIEIQAVPRGTGFLVGADVLLTNYHVLEDVIEKRVAPEDVKLRFDYRVQPSGLRSPGMVVALHSTDWLIDHSKSTQGEAKDDPDATLPTPDELDYALVKLATRLGSAPLRPNAVNSSFRGWIQVPPAEPPVAVDMPILIVQYPKENALSLAMDTSGVQSVNANKTRIRYRTNTEGGSSGSPCLDLHWGLIAIHHYGDPAYGQPRYNQGIPIFAIRERLARLGKSHELGGESPLQPGL